MFGLEHFLNTPTFSQVQTMDFSSVQLETLELRLLCQFCSKSEGISSLNLSDKVGLPKQNQENPFNLSITDIC